MKSGYSHVKDTFEKHETGYKTTHWERGIEYRKGKSIERVERPTKLHRARTLGYKAKQGYVVVRARIRKGGMHKVRPKSLGRNPSHSTDRRYQPPNPGEFRAARKKDTLEAGAALSDRKHIDGAWLYRWPRSRAYRQVHRIIESRDSL